MSKRHAHRRHIRKKGLPPETLLYTGSRESGPSKVTSIWYDDSNYIEKPGFVPQICQVAKGVSWVDIRHLSDVPLIEQVGTHFGMHLLAIEDVLDTHQRPKLEEYDNGLFFILVTLQLNTDTLELLPEQVALFAGRHFLISFQEDPDDTLALVRKRLHDAVGKVRKKGPDFLAYTVIDTIVDNYYIVLDQLEAKIHELEESLHLHGDTPWAKARIFELKRLVSEFRHRVAPLRDAAARFYRTDSEIIEDANRPYFRDVMDHVAQILDNLDNQRDMLLNIEALFHAEASNRLNNVMRLLTVISTIFIPLSFIAGVYGMNFDNMPELHEHYAYFWVLGIMFALMIGMLTYFKTKKWI